MNAPQSAEKDSPIFAEVTFTCEWCGGRFNYTPGLIGSDLGVRINVERIGERCIRHAARVVDLRVTPPGGSDE